MRRPLFLTLALLTACTTTPDTSSNDDTPTAVTDDTSPTNAFDTLTVIEATWNQKTDAERDTMCRGIDQFGTDWAAVALKAGAEKADPDTANALDWDEAALILQQKCENR